LNIRRLKIAVLVCLIFCFLFLSYLLFNEWRKVPRKDPTAWRIEYADLSLDKSASSTLKIQLRVETTLTLKRIALPNLELILTNDRGNAIAYTELTPKEWLPPEIKNRNRYLFRGVPNEVEITAEIPLRIPENATGYQVQIIYH